ncbi:MAG: hypothetical protein ACRCTW_11145 [Lactococcus garvieae]
MVEYELTTFSGRINPLVTGSRSELLRALGSLFTYSSAVNLKVADSVAVRLVRSLECGIKTATFEDRALDIKVTITIKDL